MEPYAREIEERGSYVRHNAQMFATWFTWHVAANFAAMGWVATSVTDNQNLTTEALCVLPILFIIVSPLAIGACMMMKRSMQAESVRIQSAWSSFVHATGRIAGVDALVPIQFYQRCLNIMATGCVLLAVVWSGILVWVLNMPTTP